MNPAQVAAVNALVEVHAAFTRLYGDNSPQRRLIETLIVNIARESGGTEKGTE